MNVQPDRWSISSSVFTPAVGDSNSVPLDSMVALASFPSRPQAKYTAMVSLLITALIAHFMLFDAMFKDGQLVFHLVVLHYIVPAMAILDWLLFDEKGKMAVWGPFTWLSLAAVYLVVVMIGAGPLGLDLGGGTTAGQTRYPYTFLDPAISGVDGVALFIGAMVVAFVLIGYLIFGIDKAFGRVANRT